MGIRERGVVRCRAGEGVEKGEMRDRKRTDEGNREGKGWIEEGEDSREMRGDRKRVGLRERKDKGKGGVGGGGERGL